MNIYDILDSNIINNFINDITISSDNFLFLFFIAVFFCSPLMISFYTLFYKKNLPFFDRYGLICVKLWSIQTILLSIGFCLSLERDFLLPYFIILFIICYVYIKCNNKLLKDKEKLQHSISCKSN